MSTIDTVRRLIGRRHKISRDEMRAILEALAADGVSLENGYMPGTTPYHGAWQAAHAWAKACRGITCISVDSRGLRDGQVRYDEPGRMHPMQHAELLFAPESLGRYEYDQIGQLRRHAARVLVVRDDPAPIADLPGAHIYEQGESGAVAAPAPKPLTCECENGHRWQTEDPKRDWKCPTCGESWV